MLERILNARNNEGEWVADFFCGTGTTATVVEKTGRDWIATDLGTFALHTTRKRRIQSQCESEVITMERRIIGPSAKLPHELGESKK